MKERYKLYSCIIHHELERGNKLSSIADSLGLPYKKALELKQNYNGTDEMYSCMELWRLLRLRKNARDVLARTRMER